jgi:UrcA family protein
MNRQHQTRTISTAIATTAALIFALSAPALAQDKSRKMEEITVQAPINVEREALHSASDPMVKTEVIELKREIYIGDLDLSRHADVETLESRIEQVARESCSKLSDMFPLSNPRSKDSRRCVDRAIKSAMAEKEAAIAAAQ